MMILKTMVIPSDASAIDKLKFQGIQIKPQQAN